MNTSSSEVRLFRTLKAPLSVQIEVTENCNHRCTHCYNYWKKGDKCIFENMTFATAKKVADEVINSQVFGVTLTGGEPFLNFDVTMYLVNRFKEAGIQVSINSNLTLITPSIIDELKEANVLGILTSILGDNEEVHDKITCTKGSFLRLLEALEMCKEKNFPVSANMVVTRENLDTIENVAKIVNDYGCVDFTFTIALQPECDIDNSDRYLSVEELKVLFNRSLKVTKRFLYGARCLIEAPYCFLCELDEPSAYQITSCGAGTSSCVIGSNGNVRDCPLNSEIYGNLCLEPLKTIWLRMDKWRTTELIPDDCLSCKLLGECFGGCRRQSYVASHLSSFKANNPMMVKANEDKAFALLQENNLTQTNDVILGNQIQFEFDNMRTEDFGGVVVNGDRRIFLDEEAYNFISSVLSDHKYAISDIGYEYEDFLKSLVFMGFAKTNN